MHKLFVRHSYSPFLPFGFEGLVEDFASLPPLVVDESEEAGFDSVLLLSPPVLPELVLSLLLLSAFLLSALLLSAFLLSDDELDDDLVSADADFL